MTPGYYRNKCHSSFPLAIPFPLSRQFSILPLLYLLLNMFPGFGQDKDESPYLLHLINFNKYIAGTYTSTILPAVLFLTILLSCCFYRWHLSNVLLRYIIITTSLSQTCKHKSGEKQLLEKYCNQNTKSSHSTKWK